MRLENNLGGDNLYTSFRVYVEGVQIPFSSGSVQNVYRGLPTATITVAPWRGFSEITKGYFPKIQIFYRDFNQGLAPYDIQKMVGSVPAATTVDEQAVLQNAQETFNLVERNAYKVIFDGVITSITDSKSLSGDGGSSSVTLNCVHPYYMLNEILFRFTGTSNKVDTAQDSAFGIMADGDVGSMFAIEQALAGVHEPRDSDVSLEDGGGDISVLSDTMSDNYWRLQGMPGVIVVMWNSLKRASYMDALQTDKSIMTKMYIPLMETGLSYFSKMTGHPIIEGSIQKAATPPGVDNETPAAPTTPYVENPANGTPGPSAGTPQTNAPVATPGPKKMSDKGKKDLVQFSEGRRYRLYDDATGVEIQFAAQSTGTPTIGVGHAVSKTSTQYDRTTLTDGQVDALLNGDLASAESSVNALGLTLSQGQFDALTDLTFNVGPGGRGGKDGALWQASGEPSTIVRYITEGNTQAAADGFLSWVYSGGQVSQGLVTRRSRDRSFFLDAPLPSAQQIAANAKNAKGSQEELSTANGKLIPGNIQGSFSKAVAEQILQITQNDLASGGTGESMSFGQFIEMFTNLIEYDHLVMNSPAAIRVSGRREIIDHVYKPRMFSYYAPICNVVLPSMYESMSVNIGTDQVPSRAVFSGMPFSADSAANQTTEAYGINFVAPHSVRKALSNGGNLQDTLQSQRAVPGKYEWGTGVRTTSGILPYWYSVLSNQGSGNVGDLSDADTLNELKAAWLKLYPEDPTLNPWDSSASGLQAYNRLFVTGVDQEYSNIYAQSRQGQVDGVFNPFIIPGYPMDVVDPSPLRESYHGFCTSVSHYFDGQGASGTSIGMSSCYTFSEIATCYIPGTSPWLLAQLKMTDNLSMYGNTAAFQRACQYYNDVLGVGAADPTILESYSTGKPIPVKRNLGVWEIGQSDEGTTRIASLYGTTLGNLNLVARNIATLIDVEQEHCALAETFIDIDMWNQGAVTVQQVRKGPWVNDQSATKSSTLRGRDMESSAFLTYDDGETGDPVLKQPKAKQNLYSLQPSVGKSISQEANEAAAKAVSLPTIMPKLGKRCSVGVLDANSSAILATCDPRLIQVVMKVIETRPVVVTSGYRSSAKQASLESDGSSYAQGAKEGSRHRKNPSWAVDIVPCNDLHASSRAVMANFAQFVLQVGNSMGITLRWGGNFSTYDPVHFDLGLG